MTEFARKPHTESAAVEEGMRQIRGGFTGQSSMGSLRLDNSLRRGLGHRIEAARGELTSQSTETPLEADFRLRTLKLAEAIIRLVR